VRLILYKAFENNYMVINRPAWLWDSAASYEADIPHKKLSMIPA
jgi:hypothetical protein